MTAPRIIVIILSIISICIAIMLIIIVKKTGWIIHMWREAVVAQVAAAERSRPTAVGAGGTPFLIELSSSML